MRFKMANTRKPITVCDVVFDSLTAFANALQYRNRIGKKDILKTYGTLENAAAQRLNIADPYALKRKLEELRDNPPPPPLKTKKVTAENGKLLDAVTFAVLVANWIDTEESQKREIAAKVAPLLGVTAEQAFQVTEKTIKA